jgi:aarF domain-containing kinase
VARGVAEGLYTEMDFRNEALNMVAMKSKLAEFHHSPILNNLIIPDPLLHMTSRRVMTMEWVTGVKLTQLPAQQIRDLVKIGQEAFLVQLLEIGTFPQLWQ